MRASFLSVGLLAASAGRGRRQRPHAALRASSVRGMLESVITGCDSQSCLRISAGCLIFYSFVLAGSRFVFSPAIAPVTYAKLAKQPGAQGYWDSSFASTVNGVINTVLVVWVVARDPRLLTLSDAYVRTDETCAMVIIFLTWCIFDLAQVVYYFRHWDGMGATLVHHISAILAWLLYLEGGYGHALSLLGVFCEATNPFMNLRYFLSTAEMKASTLYMANGLAFCLSWLLVRILFAIPFGTYTISMQYGSLVAACADHPATRSRHAPYSLVPVPHTSHPSLRQPPHPCRRAPTCLTVSFCASIACSGLPLWRRLLYFGFFSIGAVLNLMWGYKLFNGAIKILTANKSA